MGACLSRGKIPWASNPPKLHIDSPSNAIPAPISQEKTPIAKNEVNSLHNHKVSNTGSAVGRTTPLLVLDEGSRSHIYAGFDFGTIFSSVGVWKEEKPVLVEYDAGERILGISVTSAGKTKFAKNAMQHVSRGKADFTFKMKMKLHKDCQIDVLPHLIFLNELAITVDSNLNSAILCLPCCFGSIEPLKNQLKGYFQNVIFISDIVAIFLCFLRERNFGLGTQECEFMVVSWGGGFLTCGKVSQRNGSIIVENVRSVPNGGDSIVLALQQAVLIKANWQGKGVKAPGRFWNECMAKVACLYDVESFEIGNLSIILGCEADSVVVSWGDIKSRVEVLARQAIAELNMTIGTDRTTQIIIAGGMCRCTMFRDLLEQSFPGRILELFNMSIGCAMGVTTLAGVLNSKRYPMLTLCDYWGKVPL